MVWGLYSADGESMEPWVLSSGKTQEQVIDEVLEAFESSSIVMLRGGVGSGKSIMAATVCGAVGGGIISVPVKPLQEQYVRDFEGRLRIILDDEPLRIMVLKGRDNFKCLRHRTKGFRCSHRSLVCTMPLGRGIPRWKVAKRCPHWAPIYPTVIGPLKESGGFRLRSYASIAGEQFVYMRENPCGYYAQGAAYLQGDVLVYNTAKWFADTAMGRKPLVNVEVFDEGDMFLDSLCSKTRLTGRTITRLKKESGEAVKELRRSGKTGEAAILRKKARNIESGFEVLLDETSKTSLGEIQGFPEDYLKELSDFLEVLGSEFSMNLRMKLENLLHYRDDAFFYASQGEVNFFIADPARVLGDLMDRSADKLLFVSATLQSPEVLREIYNIHDFVYVEGEPRMRGRIHPRRIGGEQSVNWRNWGRGGFRHRYWGMLSRIIQRAKRPTLVQVHAYQYLPEDGDFPGLPTQGLVKDMDQDETIAMFKLGKEDLLFSTKTDRGIDLPGDSCRSIVLLKYPYPGLKDPFFAVMRRRLGDDRFWKYYRDLAWREFQQQIGRGMRGPGDWVEVWSPDLTVHQKLRRLGAA
jgi:Rad3-related DNA helicase